MDAEATRIAGMAHKLEVPLGNTSAESDALDVGLYIHVAFCETKCYYCDFNTYAGLGRLIDRYARALAADIRALPPSLPGIGQPGSRPIRIGSIFFGGGTPSLLTPTQVGLILDAARQWAVDPAAEITLEINPDDTSVDYFRALRAIGVNRISLGVQSFDDAMLQRLGRRHDAQRAREAYVACREAGFDNVSLDLMFALPDQSLAHWENTVDEALRLRPEHLSLYNLTIEAETTFGKWAAAGKLTVPDDDAAADMYQLAIDRLGAAGYEHYEISNWARSTAHQAQHNLRYWRNQPYFGVGAGAHSSYAGYRYAEIRSPFGFVRRLETGKSAVDFVETIDRELELAETMILGLRLREGIDTLAFLARFGLTPDDAYPTILRELRELGLVRSNDHLIVLTDRGRFVGNEVFYRFLPDRERPAPA